MTQSASSTAAPGQAPAVLRQRTRALREGREHAPRAVLGVQTVDDEPWLLVWRPGAVALAAGGEDGPAFQVLDAAGLFALRGSPEPLPGGLVHARFADGTGRLERDPYSFDPTLGELDLHLFGEGRHRSPWRFLGAHAMELDGVAGVRFAVWAPNAARVSVVGDFDHWDGRLHPMESQGGSGVFALFVPGLAPGTLYKFEIRDRTGAVQVHTDPWGRHFERRPATAAVVEHRAHRWTDDGWLARRAAADWLHAPMSVYEVHLGSWQRDAHGAFLDYRTLATRLADHVSALGFTHVELMPVTEHPFDGSWGYQSTGYFAPTSRFGTPDDFRAFVDHLHGAGIGVLLDWAPAHFPRDAHALARFDGTALYEHEDPRRGEHRDWGTLIFNYGRNEVRNFLVASALYWLEEFHLDGLRVDAVASMLYLDYSREADDWVPNEHGGRENLEAIAFVRELNELAHARAPGAVIVAEESTAWPMVSRPVDAGGLGFSMKWNMGWMNDTLAYMSEDPVHRRHHHRRLTFGMLYAFTENFVLPLSHDEVVHGKGSLLGKMPGDDWQRFANLRLLLAWQFTHPGRKLLFMGSELAPREEWRHDAALPWHLRQYPEHGGIERLIGDLNALYVGTPALHGGDFEADGFRWIDCDDALHSVIAFRRCHGGEEIVVVINFTPVVRAGHRLGLPHGGPWRERLNTDSRFYGGSDCGNGPILASDGPPWHGLPTSVQLTLPPLAALVLAPA